MLKQLGLIALSLLAILAPIPAQAGDYAGDDRIGDVKGFIHDPDPRPCGSITDVRHDDPRYNDITRLEVEHTATRLDLRMLLRDLPPYRSSSQSFPVRTPDNTFTITLSAYRGETIVFVDVEKPPPAVTGPCGSFSFFDTLNPCRGGTGVIDQETNTVAVSVPRRCLGAPRWVRVGAESSAGRHSYQDAWAPRGSKPSGPWGHVYGPRVRAAR